MHAKQREMLLRIMMHRMSHRVSVLDEDVFSVLAFADRNAAQALRMPAL